MPADGKTAAFSPPGDIGNPGSGNDATIHRLRFAPEVSHCGFYQLSKIMLITTSTGWWAGDNFFRALALLFATLV
jgi:hypothetical protein